ncbi:MAG TPA: hypothetical protein VN719_14390 [Gemmatimonadales bacterium]|nr:hypothetical protein [Gemmatimonadales bacterium]
MNETPHNDTYLDSLLDKLVTVEAKPAWGDVVGRARRAHRRYVMAAAGLGALVLAPSGWAIQHTLLSAAPTIPAPPPYQPGDKVWATTPPITPVATTIDCNTIEDAATLLAKLEQQGSPINTVLCSNATLSSAPGLPAAPAPYKSGDSVTTSP